MKIQSLEQKLKSANKEKSKLKHQLSASKTGAIGGYFDSSSSG